MTTEINPTLTKVEDAFKTLAWKPLANAELTSLGLNFFPINTIINYFLNNFYENKVKVTIDMAAIKFLNAAHEDAFNKSVVALQAIEANKGIKSDEYKNAQSAALDALAKFGHYNK